MTYVDYQQAQFLLEGRNDRRIYHTSFDKILGVLFFLHPEVAEIDTPSRA